MKDLLEKKLNDFFDQMEARLEEPVQISCK